MAGDRTAKPGNHEAHFRGDFPCDKDGNPIQAINNGSNTRLLAEGIEIDHSFSNRPKDGYEDYYHKVTQYCRIICAEAQALDPNVKPQTHKVIEPVETDSVFKYFDTNSSRAEIELISDKLKPLKIAIVGLGGTGSYVLDFVSKTQVSEIHLFDKDELLSHNAFRTPGAASIEILREQPKKVNYLHEVYTRMRTHIFPHPYHIDSSKLYELDGMDFVFVCLDDGEAKKVIVEHLLQKHMPFSDVGMGLYAVDGALTGSLRVTTATPSKSDHINDRISFASVISNDYDKNVQIAELNALNAALAVIKWKKIFGVYHDLEHEHNETYLITTNRIQNDDANA
jgi:hypothetical protein